MLPLVWKSIKIPSVRVLQQPPSPLMRARQCKHNSRNMKRSGDSEGEKRRKVLIAFFSVRSGIFLRPVARWISNAPYVILLAAFWRLESRECQRIPHLASFLYCVFHFSPPVYHNEELQWDLNATLSLLINSCSIASWQHPTSSGNTTWVTVCGIFVGK